MGPILALAMKDLRLLLRDRAGFFFTLVFPLLMAVFFGTIFSPGGGGGSDIRLAVVDEDGTAESREFIADLSRGQGFAVRPVATREEAQRLVRSGELAGFVAVASGFGQASRRIFWGEPMELIVGVDPSRAAEKGMIEGKLTALAYQRMAALFSDRGFMRDHARGAIEAAREAEGLSPAFRAAMLPFLGSLERLADELPEPDAGGPEAGAGAFNPVAIESVDVARARRGPANAYGISFPQGVLWGVMGCAATFGISLVVERTRGTLMRLRVAPLRAHHVLLGKGLACFLATTVIAGALLVLARLAFGVRPVAPGLLVVAVLCISLGFVGIMMLLSVLGRTEAAAGGIGWAVLLVCAMFGGGMVPLFLMPGWMQTASSFSPVKWSILALEGAIWRGFTPAQMVLPCGILLGIGGAGLAVGAAVFVRSGRE